VQLVKFAFEVAIVVL